MDHHYIKQKLSKMFNKCTDQLNIKEFAKKIITERNETHEKDIKEHDNKLNQDHRSIE